MNLNEKLLNLRKAPPDLEAEAKRLLFGPIFEKLKANFSLLLYETRLREIGCAAGLCNAKMLQQIVEEAGKEGLVASFCSARDADPNDYLDYGSEAYIKISVKE